MLVALKVYSLAFFCAFRDPKFSMFPQKAPLSSRMFLRCFYDNDDKDAVPFLSNLSELAPYHQFQRKGTVIFRSPRSVPNRQAIVPVGPHTLRYQRRIYGDPPSPLQSYTMASLPLQLLLSLSPLHSPSLYVLTSPTCMTYLVAL